MAPEPLGAPHVRRLFRFGGGSVAGGTSGSGWPTLAEILFPREVARQQQIATQVDQIAADEADEQGGQGYQVGEAPAPAAAPSQPTDLAGQFAQGNVAVAAGQPLLANDYQPAQHGTLFGTVTLATSSTFAWTPDGGVTWNPINGGQALTAGASYPFAFPVHPGQDINLKAGEDGGGLVIITTFDAWFTPAVLAVTGAVAISGPVTIVGTTTVTVTGPVTVTGTVNIGLMPAITINSSGASPVYVNLTNSVQLAAGTANIGTINIAAGQSVQIAAGSATIGTVNLASGTKINIGTVDTLTAANATIDNTFVPANSLVLIGETSSTISNLANGAQTTLNSVPQASRVDLGDYDAFVIMLESTLDGAYYSLVSPVSLYAQRPGNAGYEVLAATQAITPANLQRNHYDYYLPPTLLDAPQAFNDFGVTVENVSGGTISSDTVTCWFFGHRAQTQVSNPTTSPVPSNTTNTFVPSNELVFFGTATVPISNLLNGSSVFPTVVLAAARGLYDGMVVVVDSAGETINGTYGDLQAFAFLDESGIGLPTFTGPANQAFTNMDGKVAYYLVLFGSVQPTDEMQLSITNISGATIASDTLTVKFYGIRAQVAISQTSGQNIVNSRPSVTGAIISDTPSTTIPANGEETVTMYGATGYISRLINVVAEEMQAVPSATGGDQAISISIVTANGTLGTLDGVASYDKPVQYQYGYWVYADVNQYPPASAGMDQSWPLKAGIKLSPAVGVEFQYANTTNASQTNGRGYFIAVEQEATI
jgi:hypothetical protein